ncbi:hypothetical protein LUZ63_020531 [Rhynchospora breviuscula]|uniref:4-coumarate--CoA ligase n=1 Tax=Rhynchospora breviuscula TaxID=2022672 RepID=A0A9P9Z8W6_9POAL|nr:hypothetical protein LUZ63_020531 [Rhynchospora breviuscula]
MQDEQLTIGAIRRHVVAVHPDSEVVTATADGTRRRSYAELGRRVGQLANGLRSLGITGDQRVATFQWNNAEHLEAYLAVPSMGAVLHTLNIRLFPEHLVYIANHAEDEVVIVDDSLVGLLAPHLSQMQTVRHVLVAGPDAAEADLDSLRADGTEVGLYEDLLAGQPEDFDWPELDERDAAAMCYTSGTTGNPKGVVYSHRSAWLHSQAVNTGSAAGLSFADRVLPIVPMFHANSWGLAYSALMSGASLCMPDRWLQAEPLVRFVQASQPTVSGAVPTVWNDVLGHLDQYTDVRLDSLRLILCGGSAVPVALQKALWERHGLLIRQAWGMTETSPVASTGIPPVGVSEEESWRYRGTQGRLFCGVEGRIVGDDGQVLPSDGAAVGELEVRGPWVTGGYYDSDDPEAAAKFHDGWLRTGDVGMIDELGYITLTDRSKDVIKSGGEWISSVDLENALMGHEAVLEAAVVGIPDEKWDERPLASVVVREGRSVTAQELRDFLARDFAKWQLPDAWAFIDEVPRTSVGKFDKKVIRRWPWGVRSRRGERWACPQAAPALLPYASEADDAARVHLLDTLADERGVFTTRDALAAGLDDRDVTRAVRSGEWHRIRRGAFVAGPTWAAADPEARHLIRAAAVHRSYGDRVAFSHVTAALLHGLSVWDVDLNRVHVTRLDGGAGRTEPDVVHHEGLCLSDGDVGRRGSSLVTAPARAALECGLLGDTERAVVVLDSALRLTTTPLELASAYDLVQHWPGARHLEIAVRMADARAESVGESRARWLFRVAGLPAPQLQHPVRDARGVLLGTTDFAWPENGALGEFDGRVKYGRLLLPGQDPGSVVFAEKQREDAIRRETGWVLVRLVWSDLERPRLTADRVLRSLRAA